MSYLFNSKEENNLYFVFNSDSHLYNEPYMCYIILKSQLKNSLFNTNTLISLPKDININNISSLKYEKEDINEYNDTNLHYNIRCATKLPYETLNNYKNHICNCNNDNSCKFKNYNRHCSPAITYNGKNLVKCNCQENIITKIINDWKYLYELDNIDILLHSIDDYGSAQTFHIVIINKTINIYYSDGFYGI